MRQSAHSLLLHVRYAVVFVRILIEALVYYITSRLYHTASTPPPASTNSRRHIAVIGGGIAGCGAAYSLLQSGYSVTLYEVRSALGGNSKTYEWTVDINNTQHKVTTGLSVLAWPQQYFRNYIHLLRKLDVETTSVELPFAIRQQTDKSSGSSKVSDSIYAHNMTTPLSQQYTADIHRWRRMVNAVRRVSLYLNGNEASMYHMHVMNPFNIIPVRLLCYIYGISCQFWHNIVVSMYQSSFLTVNLNTIPSTILPVVDDLISIDHTRIPRMITWNTNSVDVFSKLAAGATIKLNHPVLRVSIKRNSQGRHRITVDGDTTVYDNVVFACSSNAAINALERGRNNVSSALSTMLHSVTYTEHTDTSLVTGVVHTDVTVLPAQMRQQLLRDYANYIDVRYDTKAGRYRYHNTFIVSSWMPQLRVLAKKYGMAHNDIAPMFITYSEPDNTANIDVKQIKHHVDNTYAHPNLSYRNQCVALLLRLFQGQNGVYYCGNYATPANGHDLSLLSGFAVAEQIGASYPFADNAAAGRDFARLKLLMGLR